MSEAYLSEYTVAELIDMVSDEELAEAAREVVEMQIEDTLRIAVEAAVADHLDTRANLAVDTLGFVAHYQRDANRCFSQVWH